MTTTGGMLGKTAGGIFWLFRYLERSENMARLIEAGLRIALTRSATSSDEWHSVISTAGQEQAFEARHDEYTASNVVDWLLRDKQNPNSIMANTTMARNNGRMTRTAITREVWEAINEAWLVLRDLLRRPVREADLPEVLATVRRQSGLVRGALHGTMLRNDMFNFARIGTFLERADNTARILDVKYYILLPSVSFVGSPMDSVQWDNILRSISAQRTFRWINPGDIRSVDIANFMIMDNRFPRSLSYCYRKIVANLEYVMMGRDDEPPSIAIAKEVCERVDRPSIEDVFQTGVHEFLIDFLKANDMLAGQIERDFRFYQ